MKKSEIRQAIEKIDCNKYKICCGYHNALEKEVNKVIRKKVGELQAFHTPGCEFMIHIAKEDLIEHLLK